ncbi:iron complex transport system substrate-binding protein [Haladaptatus litoreus]|uniref:Iron complex transport system substrate-binding protein n=1 Tax=Haladaptatus litoreus TaxID=553468 RepID=A0A1N7CMM1_9EURY|nr:ABC transporter substrate-binding protein [Haladaptatus litoreus]SIR64869.1 iron complex transport system substrate-binding protein [Haladaptatus litoreus]
MSDDSSGHETPTRRDYMKYGGTVIGGGLLAGCTGDSPETDTSTDETTIEEADTSTEDGSNTVEMFPVGEVEFEEVPETWTSTSNDAWADMAIALGQADGCRTPGARTQIYYDALGIEVDTDWPWLWQDGGYSKEMFYERDADLHLLDPNLVMQWDSNWNESDIEEIESNVGPFFCCYNRRVTNEWQKELDYPERVPSMLEAFEKLGEVFEEEERVEGFLDVHAEMQAELDDRLNGVEPATVGLINGGSEPAKGKFYPLNISDSGYEMKTYQDLGVEDEFAKLDDGVYGGTIDYEKLLEVDPGVIVVQWEIINTDANHFDPEAFDEQFVAPMEEDPVGSQLTAVQQGNVYPGPYPEQGPIANLFQTELTGQLLYPEQFGEFDPQAYPEVPEEYQLFDRQRVADIINGDI